MYDITLIHMPSTEETHYIEPLAGTVFVSQSGTECTSEYNEILIVAMETMLLSSSVTASGLSCLSMDELPVKIGIQLAGSKEICVAMDMKCW